MRASRSNPHADQPIVAPKPLFPRFCSIKCNYSPYSVLWDKVFGTHKPFAVRGTEGGSAAEQQRRRASYERSVVTATLGFAAKAGPEGSPTVVVTAPIVSPTACATTAIAAAATIAAAPEPPALKPAPSRSTRPSMSLGSGASPNGEPPQRRDKQTAEVVKRLEGLLYVPIADQAELAAAHENEGRSETQTDKQTSEVVARLERLLRVQSPTKTSQRLAKLAAVDENENKGETYVLMRGLVVVLTYGALFVGLCVSP